MPASPFELHTERLGPLPLLNHFLDRLELIALLDRFVPTEDPRCHLPYARGLGVLLRSILTEREPIYRLGEVVSTFAPEGFGLSARMESSLSDDAVGRALDRLFDADRGSLLTQIVLAAAREFDLVLDELHNDSTTVKFTGQYPKALGRSMRGKHAPFITYGFSKDHRPDLKQLLFILTATRDGGVPVQFRSEAGNQNDARTHEETWEALCRLTGRTDFLYVADSKLCNGQAMEYLDRRGGRFVTVLPRTRMEDRAFRKWIQENEPAWEKVWDRPNPHRKGGPRDRWYVWRYHLPSGEGWPVIWVFGSLLRSRQFQSRWDRIARAEQRLKDLAEYYRGPKPRRKAKHEVWKQITDILEIAPVLLKNEGRIEALFFLYFIALLVRALIERELRRAMEREGIEELPLYPEERLTRRPTCEQILRLFSLIERHRLRKDGKQIQIFEPELTDLQKQLLALLGIPETAYRRRS